MNEEFDFDELLGESSSVERAISGAKRMIHDIDSIGTLSCASNFFQAAYMLYMEERLRDPLQSPAEAMENAKARATHAIDTRTVEYFRETIEYRGIDDDSPWDSVEEAVEAGRKTEKEILEAGFKAIEGIVRYGEPFYFFCVAASGKTPEESLARIRNDQESEVDGILDGLNWK